MKEPEVILTLLLVAYQQAPTFREPAQGSFDDPTTWRIFLAAFLSWLLSTGRANVPTIVVFFDSLPAQLVVVAGIEAAVLWLLLSRLRALDRNRLNGLTQQEMIVDISSSDDDPKRPALAIDQQAFLTPASRD